MHKLKLLANLPLYVDNIPIYSPSLKSIADIGEIKYSQMVNMCTISKDSLTSSIDDSIENYDILLYYLNETKDFHSDFLKSLFYFTKVNFDIYIVDNDIVFRKDDIVLNRMNYNQFIKVIKLVNCISTQEEKELDEFDRRVLEMEKKIREAQNKNQKPYELSDLISAVANMDGNGLNIINIWDLNIFQFHEQLQRGQLKEQYHLAIKQILAGAKPDDIKVEHYFKSLDEQTI